MNTNKLSSFVIGLALFSMFFGSGNLIFPLFIGQLAQDQWGFATLGFLMTAVLLPFLGVIAMVVYRGDYTAFFSCMGRFPGFLLTFLLLTVWIPLGSGPRCITLAYASIVSHTPHAPPLWLFSLAYCIVVTLVIYKKAKMIEILGRFLTPMLLCCLALIVLFGLDIGASLNPSNFAAGEILFRGLKEGYNTMDLIASFFFSASVIEILKKASGNEELSLKKAFKASVVGIIVLGAVYIGLISLSAYHAATLQDVPKDQLLVHIAKSVLGSKLGIVAAGAVFLACFTTSVALVSVYADFLSQKVFGSANKYFHAILITHGATFVMSLYGLQGITFLTEPMLQVFYPTLLVLIVFNVGRAMIARRAKANAGAEG